MRDEQDAVLTRLFAEHEKSLPAAEFLMQLVARLEREHRRQRAFSFVTAVAILVLVAAATPWIAQVTAVFAEFAAAATEIFGLVVASPIAWLVGGALAFAFLPVVYVWRTWHD
jgi:Fe2+ transport system protein B